MLDFILHLGPTELPALPAEPVAAVSPAKSVSESARKVGGRKRRSVQNGTPAGNGTATMADTGTVV